MRWELWAKDAEICELSHHVDRVVSEKYILRRKFNSMERLLQDATEDNGKYKSLHFGLGAALHRIRGDAELHVSLHEKGGVAEDSCVESTFEWVFTSSHRPDLAGPSKVNH